MYSPPQPPKKLDAHDYIRIGAFIALAIAVVTITVMILFPKPYVSTGPTPPQPGAKPEPQAPPAKTDTQIRAEYLEELGLDPNIDYPYWPLVYTWPEVSLRRYGTRYLVGEVRNYGSERYRYVGLSFGLYKDGVKVADVRDSTAGLRAGERWRYEMFVFYEGDFDTYKVNYLTAY
jgi:hypothetical protein